MKASLMLKYCLLNKVKQQFNTDLANTKMSSPVGRVVTVSLLIYYMVITHVVERSVTVHSLLHTYNLYTMILCERQKQCQDTITAKIILSFTWVSV